MKDCFKMMLSKVLELILIEMESNMRESTKMI